jgi:hypothetical protein
MADEQQTFRQRLLNVARALRESPDAAKFTMETFFRVRCGTPACALGHYACRTDLQSAFAWDKRDYYPTDKATGNSFGYDERPVLEHFGLSAPEACELFATDGCDNAVTATDAAEYIEHFVQRKYGSASRDQ